MPALNAQSAILDICREFSESRPNRKVVLSTPRLSFWTVLFRHNPYTDCRTLLNLVPSCHSSVLKSTFCLARSMGLPSKKVFSNMQTHEAEKSRNLAGVLKEKQNKYENRIEVL